MMSLLPMRGWVADVMAMERAGTALSAEVASPAPAHECHAQPHGHESTPAPHDSVHAEGDCASCTVCQICHSTALAAPAMPALLAHGTGTLPPAPMHRHTSAEPVQGFKPPIS